MKSNTAGWIVSAILGGLLIGMLFFVNLSLSKLHLEKIGQHADQTTKTVERWMK